MKTPARLPAFLGALLPVLPVLVAVPALILDSSVADEHPHILSGWLYWASGRPNGGLDNPPLGQLLVAAPLRLLRSEYQFPADTHLWLARLPVLLLFLALVLLLRRWARELGGVAVALAALAGLCLEPNLLAHGHLATLDLPLTFLWWASLWLWRDVLRLEAAGARLGLRLRAGAFFALVVALGVGTKFTTLLLWPACGVVTLAVCKPRSWRLPFALLVGTLAVVALSSHVFYAFEPSRHGLPEHFLAALAGKLEHRGEGHYAYLAGRSSMQGFAAYYLVALLVKTPLPLLGLALVGLGARRLQRLDMALLVVPAVVLVGAFSLVRVHIGLRHVLPVLPALVLLAAVGSVALWRGRILARLALLAAMLVWVGGMARVAPQYLAYFNILGGGAAGGHRFLLDSNLAWGQDDARLQRFLERAASRGENWEVDPPGGRARPGRLAVDANTLHQLLRADASPYAWLRPLRPVGYAGYSWRLYDLKLDTFAAAAASGAPTSQQAYAEALAAAGDADKARAAYARAARTPALCRSAVVFALDAGDHDTARAWLQEGLALAPRDAELLALQRRLQLEAAADSSAAGMEFALGMWWAERGDVERALPLLERAAATGAPEALHAYAMGLAQRGRFAAAAHVLEPGPATAERAALRALARAETQGASGSGPAALMDLSTTLFRVREYDRAAAALMRLLHAAPADGAALALLCEIQVRTKLRIVPERLTPRPAPGVAWELVARSTPGALAWAPGSLP